MRLGINIPHELHNRLIAVKGQYNISEVCRAALQELVDYHESAMMRVEWDGLREIADRYRLLDDVIRVNWGELGTQHAVLWFKRAGPNEMGQLTQRLKMFDRQGRPAWDVPVPYVEGVPDFRRTYHEREKFLFEKFGEDLYEREDFHREFQLLKAQRLYTQAFLSYVLSAREAIRKHNRATRPGVFTADPNAPPITSEDVQAAMEDFP